MSTCDEWIQKMETHLPDQCGVLDLVKAGILISTQSAANFRHKKKGPSYFKLGGRIMYPKQSVIEWLKGNKHENCKENT